MILDIFSVASNSVRPTILQYIILSSYMRGFYRLSHMLHLLYSSKTRMFYILIRIIPLPACRSIESIIISHFILDLRYDHDERSISLSAETSVCFASTVQHNLGAPLCSFWESESDRDVVEGFWLTPFFGVDQHVQNTGDNKSVCSFIQLFRTHSTASSRGWFSKDFDLLNNCISIPFKVDDPLCTTCICFVTI